MLLGMNLHRTVPNLLGLLIATFVFASACGGAADPTDVALTEPVDEAAPTVVVETSETVSASASPESSDEQSAADMSATDTEVLEAVEDAEGTVATPVAGSSEPDRGVGESEAASSYLGSYDLIDEAYGTIVNVTVDGATRTITANALPNHETGDFPNSGNPNEITEQDNTYRYTTTPTFTGDQVPVREPGVAVNGVKFEPETAETATCDTGEVYRIEALQTEFDLGLDFNNAHVQPDGTYHYHGSSAMLVEAFESAEDLVHVGFAADGFLIYYSKSGAYSSGYELDPQTRTGIDCVTSGPFGQTIDLEGTVPDGTYGSDWIYTGAGELDECNATVLPTGEYAYFVTDTFPYLPRCLNGADISATGPSGNGGGPPAGGATEGSTQGGPDLTEAAAALGVTVAELQQALGSPPPDFAAAAAALGVTAEELQAALPAPPGQ